jgi:nucleolar protein 6
MGDTTVAIPVSSPPTLPETSLSSRPSQQPKLTKKQKKAIAFRRDKSKPSTAKRKAQDNDENEEGFDQMEDLHGALVEKPSRDSDASGTNQMAAMEEECGGGSEARSRKAGRGEEGAHNVAVSPQQKRGQKHQGIGKEGCRKSDGNSQKRDEKADRKRKREDVDNGVAEEKGSTKKRKGEKDEFGMDTNEEGQGEEMSEDEGEGKKTKGKDNARFILFIGMSFHFFFPT